MIKRVGILVSLSFSWLLYSDSSQAQSFEFEDPQVVLVNGEPLDVELSGGATPYAYDVDMDGALDLLVGEYYGGRLRIYGGERGAVGNFAAHILFDEYSSDPRVPSNYPFTPVATDIDQDGLIDLVTPSWHGNISWFKRLGPQKFGQRQLLQCSNGREIDVEWTFSVAVIDWNGDQLDDLLVVTAVQQGKGPFFVFENASSQEKVVYRRAAPVQLLKGDELLQANDCRLVVVDWNTDGHSDILLSTGTDHLHLLLGQRESGQFEPPIRLNLPSTNHQPMNVTRFSVADINYDGLWDILIGQDGEQFEKRFSEREKAALESLENEYQSALGDWGRVYRSYWRLRRMGQESVALKSARKQVTNENLKQLRLHADIEAQQMVEQKHSQVWAVLGK